MECHGEPFVPHSVTLAGKRLAYLSQSLPLYRSLSRQLFIHILVGGLVIG